MHFARQTTHEVTVCHLVEHEAGPGEPQASAARGAGWILAPPHHSSPPPSRDPVDPIVAPIAAPPSLASARSCDTCDACDALFPYAPPRTLSGVSRITLHPLYIPLYFLVKEVSQVSQWPKPL